MILVATPCTFRGLY